VPPNFCPHLRQILNDFHDSLAGTLNEQFAIKLLLTIPPHLKRVATLPSEVRMLCFACAQPRSCCDTNHSILSLNQIKNSINRQQFEQLCLQIQSASASSSPGVVVAGKVYVAAVSKFTSGTGLTRVTTLKKFRKKPAKRKPGE